ncbi:MAG: transglutaminase domain-containing protein, partial [Lachnospiraceae bacterium]|nr:transglutaminase domain-containing protein [Lachnospiraceae bacterium]
MKAKTVLILLSAVILCLTGCTESQKPTTVVDNSSAVTTSSSADSESGNDKYYDSTPISQAYLSGNTANLDDKQLEIYNKAVSTINDLITPDMSDYEKELAIHDFIVQCASYDEAHLNALGIGLPNSDNPYGCLINGKAICSGYSTTFQLFMDMLEIPCKTIYATDFEGDDHSWNIVQIGGSWYYVDACWDDPIPDFTDRPVRHKYFNVSKEYMKTKHVWDDTELPDT